MNRIKWLSVSRLKPYRRLSLAFVTMVLVTLLSTSPSLTQQNSQERIDVIEKIEATATLDHQAKTINVNHAVEEHEDEAKKAGLTIPEVRTVYKKKIASLNKAKPWQDLLSLMGPVGIFIGIIGLFRGVITKKVEQLGQGAVNTVYKRFSGNKLFRNFALRRYRTSLINKYQELKIPFRPNRPLKMAEVYVPLQLLEKGEPLDAKQTVKRFKRLMIVGQPGSGKTMLLKSLALNYANGKWDIPQQPVAIALELNRLSDATLTIEQHLVEALKRDDFPNGINFVEQSLNQGMIMLLFDGLDEVNSADRPNVVRRLQDFISQHHRCRVVITCRNQVYKGEFNAQVDQTVKVVDFNDQQIRKFLRPWKQSMSAGKSVEQLLQALQSRHRIMELARNPLMLTIIAYLYTDTAFKLPHSRAQFYKKALDILLETWDKDKDGQTPNRYEGQEKKLVLQHLALYGQEQTKAEQQDRRHFTWRDVHEQVKSILPDLNLKAEDDLKPILKEICERSGLLMKIDSGEGYQFTHLTLQEFFSATQLIDDVEGLIKRFDQDPDVWRDTVKLWCGLAGDSTRLIRSVYKKDRVAAFNCLADAQKIEPDLATEILDHFKGWLRGQHPISENLGQDTVSVDSAIKAFGAVAADQRSGGRGKDVFDFLVQTLPMRGKSTKYAAQGLAATNTPEAAQVLANYYHKNSVIQPYLVRMGDLAAPKLKTIIDEYGDCIAIQHLGKIGTPLASKNLVPLLWDSREDIAIYAAVELAALLQKTDIAEDLARFPEEELYSPSPTWQGICEPFDEFKNHSIRVIAEQITYRLSQGIVTKGFDDVDLPNLDPRIILPICILSEETFKKPSNDWTDTAQAVLSSTEQGLQLASKILTLIENAFNQQPQRPHWEVVLKTLPLRIQLDVLYRLSVNRPPTQSDWQTFKTTVAYDLRISWHYRFVLAIVLLLSTIALYYAAFSIDLSSSGLVIRTSAVAACFIVPVVWLILWRGPEKPFEPSLFISLGIWGPISFCKEYGRLLRNQIVWNGVQAIFDSITNITNIRFAFAAVIATFGAAVVVVAINASYGNSSTGVYFFVLVVIYTCLFVSAALGVIAVAGVVASIFAGVVTSIFAGADASISDGAKVDTVFVLAIILAVVFSAFSSDVVGVIAVVVAIAGIGIGVWVKQANEPRFSRYLALLAAPFFFGSPVVLLFSTLFMHRVAGFSYPIIGLLGLGIVIFCTLLLKRGRQLERRAQNPLKGILPDYIQKA